MVARLIVRSLAATGVRVAVMKPVAAGECHDGRRAAQTTMRVGLMSDSNVVMPYATVNPYCLPAPVSPHLAAREVGVTIELPRVQESFAVLGAAADYVIVEGAGGWFARSMNGSSSRIWPRRSLCRWYWWSDCGWAA